MMKKGNSTRTGNRRKKQSHLRKMILGIFVSMFVLGFSVFYNTRSVDAHSNDNACNKQTKYYKTIQINSGDTLWDIADQYMDDHYDNIYMYIKELKEINGLNSDNIQDGQYLTISYYVS